MISLTEQPIIAAAGEGQTFRFAGVQVTLKVVKEDTQQGWSLLEYLAPAGFKGPGLHYHKIMEEGFYVIEGKLTFTLGDQTIHLESGGFAKAPPYALHAFRNDSEAPVRFLVYMTPGGFEGYYPELLELMKLENQWPPQDLSRLHRLLEKYDTYSHT